MSQSPGERSNMPTDRKLGADPFEPVLTFRVSKAGTYFISTYAAESQVGYNYALTLTGGKQEARNGAHSSRSLIIGQHSSRVIVTKQITRGS